MIKRNTDAGLRPANDEIPVSVKSIPEKLAFIIGCMFLIIGATSIWFAMPLQSSAFKPNGFAPAPTQFQLPCQILVGGLAAILLILRPLRSSTRWRSIIAQLCLLIVIIFPYLVMVWDPEHSMRASYFFQQLIYLNQQVSTGFNQIQVDWMKNIRLEPLIWDGETFPLLQAPLRPFQVRFIEATLGNKLYSLNEYPVAPMQPPLWESYLYGIGYSDVFLQLAGKGFFLTAIGALFLILSACLLSYQPINTLGNNLIATAILNSFTLSLCIVPIIIAAREINEADTLRAQGMYDVSIRALERASRSLPILEFNTSFHLLRGEQLIRIKRADNPDYHFAMGFKFMRDNRMEEALWEFRNASLMDNRNNSLFCLVLANVLFNDAVRLYNAGNPTSALKEWNTVLQYDSVHIAAINHIAVAEIGQENTGLAQQYADQVLAIQRYLQRAFKPVSSQAVMIKAWSLFKEGDLGKALEYMTKSKDASRI